MGKSILRWIGEPDIIPSIYLRMLVSILLHAYGSPSVRFSVCSEWTARNDWAGSSHPLADNVSGRPFDIISRPTLFPGVGWWIKCVTTQTEIALWMSTLNLRLTGNRGTGERAGVILYFWPIQWKPCIPVISWWIKMWGLERRGRLSMDPTLVHWRARLKHGSEATWTWMDVGVSLGY